MNVQPPTIIARDTQVLTQAESQSLSQHTAKLDANTKHEIIRLAQIGYANAIRAKLRTLQSQLNPHPENPIQHEELNDLMTLLDGFQFPKMIEKLKGSL